jgi:hypothetical protein
VVRSGLVMLMRPHDSLSVKVSCHEWARHGRLGDLWSCGRIGGRGHDRSGPAYSLVDGESGR